MKFLILGIVTVILFLLNLFWGSVEIPASDVLAILMGSENTSEVESFIVLGSRLPMAVTASLAGAGLAVSGLLLQTSFRNPLAGPSILGISSGASLGVALVMLLAGGGISAAGYTIGGYAAIIAGAFAGSIAVMGLLIFLSSMIRNNLMLLITGIIIGYLVSSIIMLLNASSTAEGVQSYVMWGMASFNGVSSGQLPLYCSITIAGLLMAATLMKPLDIILLGDNYARNLGINLKLVRNVLLLSTGVLTAVITAYCGPVSFIGLVVPHIARLIFRTDSHRIMIPATIISGASVALLCALLCTMPGGTILPVNAVTPLIGAPVILYVIISSRRR